MKQNLLILLLIVFSASCLALSNRCGNMGIDISGWPRMADEASERCYQLIDDEMTWDNAASHCLRLAGPSGKIGEGSIARFESFDQIAAIRQWLVAIKWHRNGVWIGGRRCNGRSAPSGFCWANSRYITSNMMDILWASGQPKSRIYLFWSADCVQLRKESNWYAYTYPCDSTFFHYSSICQFPMLPAVTPSLAQPAANNSTTTKVVASSTATTTPILVAKSAVDGSV